MNESGRKKQAESVAPASCAHDHQDDRLAAELHRARELFLELGDSSKATKALVAEGLAPRTAARRVRVALREYEVQTPEEFREARLAAIARRESWRDRAEADGDARTRDRNQDAVERLQGLYAPKVSLHKHTHELRPPVLPAASGRPEIDAPRDQREVREG